MIRKFCCILLFFLCQLVFLPVIHAGFDERYWETYAEIQIPLERYIPPLGGINIEQRHFTNIKTKTPFADIRIMTDNKGEVPYQIVTRSPETKVEELTVQMLNLSKINQKETYLEGLIEKTPIIYNMIEILTTEKNFYAQVQLSGSADGQKWNLIRGDAVIFDYSKEESLKHTKITFPDSNYKYLSIKIIKDDNKPLKITGLKIFYQKIDLGIETRSGAFINKQENSDKKKESMVIVGISPNFPARKITLITPDKNFQRKAEIHIKQDKQWIKWADDMIYNFETEKVKESKLDITFSEVFTEEIKLIIKNYDSPPLNITGINVLGYGKMLIFKLNVRQKYYIFWGNPQAKEPQYDISQLTSKHTAKDIRLFTVSEQKKNPKFIGAEKRLPFTERYKYLLYGIIVLVMAGLLILQYKVIKKTEKV